MKKDTLFKAALSGAALGLALWGGLPLLHHRHHGVPVVKGPGVTAVLRLSEFSPKLAGTAGDTFVFVLEGKEPGGKALIMGNTHSNEPEGMLSALIIIENAVVEKGTLFVIPFFNNSGSRNTRAGDGYPLYFDVRTDWGAQRFRYGNRDASPLDQWPDPDVYIHYPERQLLSYIDVRNTNRTWPGRAGGPLMERVTFGAMELMRREKIDVAIDVHGAETMFPVTNCIVAPEKSVKIATLASLTVKAMEGFENHVEAVAVGLPRAVPPGDRRPRPGPPLPPRGAHPLPRPADGAQDGRVPPRRQGPVPAQPVEEEEALRPLRRIRLAAREEGRPEPVRHFGDPSPVLQEDRGPAHRRPRRPPLRRRGQERGRPLPRRPGQGRARRRRHELIGAAPARPGRCPCRSTEKRF